MNRERTGSLPDRDNSKIGRRSLLGMTAAGLAGSLVACATSPQTQNSSATSQTPRRRFEGKVGLTTGAPPGFGRAAVRQFAAYGGKVDSGGRRDKLVQTGEHE